MESIVPIVREPPEPPRPLGKEGMRLWARIWGLRRAWIDQDLDLEHVLLLCESMDERQALRAQVFTKNEWRDRVALRVLENQVASLMGALALNPVDRKALSVGNGGQGESKAERRRQQLRAQLGGGTSSG